LESLTATAGVATEIDSLFLDPSRLKGNQRAKLFNPIENRPVVPKIGPALKLPKLLND
jgi:hypothetical protein